MKYYIFGDSLSSSVQPYTEDNKCWADKLTKYDIVNFSFPGASSADFIDDNKLYSFDCNKTDIFKNRNSIIENSNSNCIIIALSHNDFRLRFFDDSWKNINEHDTINNYILLQELYIP